MYIYLLHKVKQPSGYSANNSSGSPCILAEEGAEASLGRCNGFLKVVGPIRWQFRPKPMTANPYCPLPHRRGPRALSASQTSLGLRGLCRARHPGLSESGSSAGPGRDAGASSGQAGPPLGHPAVTLPRVTPSGKSTRSTSSPTSPNLPPTTCTLAELRCGFRFPRVIT